MTDPKTSSRTWIFIGLGAVVVAVLIGAVLFGGSASTEESGSPEVSGSLPPMPSSAAVDESATGVAAPTVTGQDFDGNEVSIENDGRAKVLIFLAHWCPHCQAEVPAIQTWLDGGGGVEGVDMYSVATAINSTRSNYPPSEWLKGEGWTVPVIRDDSSSSVLTAYGNGGFPYFVFVNSDGTVAVRTAGEIPISQLESLMQGLT
jgi:cytochrome c biogenesis protein CcmG/thiol:disulfide interchange protein DsbE